MAYEEERSGLLETLIGLAIIAGIIAGILCLIYLGYAKFFKGVPVTISLSAYFVDDAHNAVAPETAGYAQSHLRIEGGVFQGTQQVTSGIVRITVADKTFQQSVFIPVKDGHFETEDPAFRSIRPGDVVTVTAAASTAKRSETATIRLNSQAPVIKLWIVITLLALLVILSAVFLYSFTGRTTPGKNQTAIIFSYVIVVLVLGLPIAAPMLLLRFFPGAVDAMIGEPVGLV